MNYIFSSMGRLDNQPDKSRGTLGITQKQLTLSILKSMATYLLSGVCESQECCADW